MYKNVEVYIMVELEFEMGGCFGVVKVRWWGGV